MTIHNCEMSESLSAQIKDSIFRVLGTDEHIDLIISRRSKKHSPYQYYLYTIDTDSLLISASLSKQKNSKICYNMYTSAFSISENDEHFIGKILDAEGNKIFTIFTNDDKEKPKMKVFLIGRSAFPSAFFIEYNGNKPECRSPITIKSTTMETDTFKCSLYYKDQNVIILEQLEKDEFSLKVSGPFNIFYAFSISLPTIISLPQNRQFT